MISVDTARRLRDGGLQWKPTIGDRFVIADNPQVEDVFVLSNMIAEVYSFPSSELIGFNGTTEWALDSVETQDTVWLPREDQLRLLLAGTFRTLTPVDAGWQVSIEINGNTAQFIDADAEEAYGKALQHLVTGD